MNNIILFYFRVSKRLQNTFYYNFILIIIRLLFISLSILSRRLVIITTMSHRLRSYRIDFWIRLIKKKINTYDYSMTYSMATDEILSKPIYHSWTTSPVLFYFAWLISLCHTKNDNGIMYNLYKSSLLYTPADG